MNPIEDNLRNGMNAIHLKCRACGKNVSAICIRQRRANWHFGMPQYDFGMYATYKINDHSFAFLKGKCKASGGIIHRIKAFDGRQGNGVYFLIKKGKRVIRKKIIRKVVLRRKRGK